MKRTIVEYLLAMTLAFGDIARGNYRIDWYTIDGGRQSTGGLYVLDGTIGQPDADYSAADNYELLGGFWPGGPLCIVDLPDFALFADQWLQIGINMPADLDADSDVDLNDLMMFAYQWLCQCPSEWPFR